MNVARPVFAGLFALAIGSTPAHATLLADSVADFSGAQGQGNWYYGYAAGGVTTYSANAFSQMTAFDPNQAYATNAGSGTRDVWRSTTPGSPWTRLWADGGHPTGTNNTPELAVRRWLSEVSGIVTISGLLADQHWGAARDTGVDAGIFVDGVRQWTGDIGSAGSLGYDFSVAVNMGSTVDFVLGSRGLDDQDSTRFTALIQSSVPEPSTLLLAGLAFAGLGATRRTPKAA